LFASPEIYVSILFYSYLYFVAGILKAITGGETTDFNRITKGRPPGGIFPPVHASG
jgi:hypothetical protein